MDAIVHEAVGQNPKPESCPTLGESLEETSRSTSSRKIGFRSLARAITRRPHRKLDPKRPGQKYVQVIACLESSRRGGQAWDTGIHDCPRAPAIRPALSHLRRTSGLCVAQGITPGPVPANQLGVIRGRLDEAP